MKTRTLIDTLYGVISAVVPFSTQTLSPSNTRPLLYSNTQSF